MTETFVFQSALRDFLRAKRILVWLFISAALFALAKVFLSVNPPQELDGAYATLSTLFVFRVLPLASAIFSSAVIGQEVEQKTIVYLLTRPIQRWKLVLFRMLGSAVAVILVSTATLLAVSASVYGNPFANPMLVKDLMAILIGALAYGSLFVFVTLLLNKAAMVVCLLFAFVWETAVPLMPGSMSLLSIGTYLNAIAQHPSSSESGGNLGNVANSLAINAVTPSNGWAAMIFATVFFAGLCMFWFEKFEYLPREDAE